jgi:hypothetical protein
MRGAIEKALAGLDELGDSAIKRSILDGSGQDPNAAPAEPAAKPAGGGGGLGGMLGGLMGGEKKSAFGEGAESGAEQAGEMGMEGSGGDMDAGMLEKLKGLLSR